MLVRVVFSDESGVGSEDQLITVIAAIMVNLDKQWDLLIADIEEILADVFKDAGKATEYEIHGDRLAKDLKSGREKGKYSEELLHRLLLLPAKHQFPIFYGATERAGYEKQEEYLKGLRRSLSKPLRHGVTIDPTFGDCLRRANDYVNTSSEKILWIHDHAGRLTTAKHFELLAYRLQEIIQAHAPKSLVGGSPKPLTFGVGRAGPSLRTPGLHVVDAIYFGDSANSRLLQLADLCCSVITAHLLATYEYAAKGHKKTVLSSFYRLIQNQVVSDGTPPALSKWRRWF
jgi:hypothetical protein